MTLLKITAFGACMLLVFSVWGLSYGEEPAISPEYPGLIQDGGGTATHIAATLVMSGSVQYYRLHGSWPAQWRDVVEAGLVQCQLIDYSMNVVDPDDGALAGLGDVVYVHPSGTSGAQFGVLKNSVTPQTQLVAMTTPRATLAQLCAETGREEFLAIQSNEGRLAQLALCFVMNHALTEYFATKGEWPSSFQAFLASGFAPIDSSSFNPYNGQQIRGDGAHDDFLFVPSKGGANIAYVLATNEKGETPWRIH